MSAVGCWVLASLFASPPQLAPLPAESTELHLGTGSVRITKHGYSLHGLPVRGAYETTALPVGDSRRRDASRVGWSASVEPSRARVSRSKLAELVRERYSVELDESEAQLVYLVRQGRPLLAWEVRPPPRLNPVPQQKVVWLSARSGRQLAWRDLAFGSAALVYPQDPASTPEAELIPLTTLDVDGEGHSLSSSAIEVFGCVTEPGDEPPAWWNEGSCFPTQLATSDPSGDFVVPLPSLGKLEDNQAFDDHYAEVAAYYHVDRFLAEMAARGVEGARCETFTILANQYNVDAEGEPRPGEGATFFDQCDAEKGPSMVIGQGRYVDYAYDADIVHHEMAHGLIQHLAPDGLVDRRFAPHGILSESGAIHEGVADYLAMSIAGDPNFGEYIGLYGVLFNTPYLRTGENTKTCPSDIVGDWHNDGQPLAGALWSMYVHLGEVADDLVLRALPRMPPDAILDEFGQTLLEVAEELHDEGTLDDFGLSVVERALHGRGLLDCEHVIDDPDLVETGKRMILTEADDAIAPYAPGPLQLRYQVPGGAREATVVLVMKRQSGEGDLAATVLVKRADEPIEFQYEMDDETTLVIGDHDDEYELESLNGEDFIVRFDVEPREVLHLALANRYPGKVSVSNFFVAGSESDAPTQSTACGCSSGSEGGLGAWLAAGLILLAGRRRRCAARRSGGATPRG